MKKMLSLVLALMMLLPILVAAESEVGLIGGADAPTQILVMKEELPRLRFQNALDAGRRLNQTITLTELTGIETGDDMTDAAIADLIKALGVNISAQGDEASLALTLSGKDVITLGGAISGEDFYLSSNMMGGTVVVGLDEIEPLANRILDAIVAMGAIGEEEAAMLRESLAAFKAEFDAAMLEENIEDAAVAEMDFSALEAIVPMLMGKITPVDSIVVPRMCDPAVSGLQLVLTNEDIHAVLKQGYRFIMDNPMLLESLAQSTGTPTEAQLAEQWEANGQLYMTFGFYENREAFFDSQKTVESMLREGMNSLGDTEILGGDMSVAVYLDEQDQPVYITGSLPIIAEDAQTKTRTTVMISMNYTRQTVPQGMAHVCNILVDDVSMTIDALASESSVFVNVIASEPGVESVKLLEISFTETANATNPAVTDIDVVATAYDGENAVLNVVYDGEYEFSDKREYVKGKLEMTAYEYQWPDEPSVIELIDAETGTVEYVDTTVTISGDDVQPEVSEGIIAFEFSTDTLITGIDYTTDASFAVEAGGVRFGLKMTEETADPQPSIMAGNVVRPVELNEADFSNWFTGVINSFNTWMFGAIQSLPESVLMLMIYSGMQ